MAVRAVQQYARGKDGVEEARHGGFALRLDVITASPESTLPRQCKE